MTLFLVTVRLLYLSTCPLFIFNLVTYIFVVLLIPYFFHNFASAVFKLLYLSIFKISTTQKFGVLPYYNIYCEYVFKIQKGKSQSVLLDIFCPRFFVRLVFQC